MNDQVVKSILTVAVVLVLLSLLALRYEPCTLFGAYFSLSRSLPPLRKPCVILLSHAYQHIDVFAGAALCKGWYEATGARTTILMANMLHNRVYTRFVQLPFADVMFVNASGGTTARLLEASRSGHNVAMYLYQYTHGTGAYHLVRSTSCPVIVVRIRSSAPPCIEHEVVGCARKTLGKRFSADHSALSESLVDAARNGTQLPKDWMRDCLREVYG